MCSSLAETSFIETAGGRWLAGLLAESQPSTTEQCHSTCARDANCAAYVYWPNGNCELFATAPEAGYLLAQDKDATHFQKACIPSTMNKDVCGRSFERFPQMVLVGLAEEVLESSTRDQCLAACNQADLCKSVMFFYNGGQCVLNSVDHVQKAHLFSPLALNDTIVDYYERRCEGAWSSWGVWSDCSGGQQRRSRVCLQGFQRCKGGDVTVRTCAFDSSSPTTSIASLGPYLNSISIQANPLNNSTEIRRDSAHRCSNYERLGFASYAECLRKDYTKTRT
uniref:Apple domain-containing protein n=1 Tax=Plectus sambesii TaxID=2011161 RepID=A0A914XFN2_9BILA